jgi:hypothetical protein
MSGHVADKLNRREQRERGIEKRTLRAIRRAAYFEATWEKHENGLLK